MIINAQCHRNFMDNSCVQVALYDDRLEVTSPGMLFGGLTLEEAMSGRSKIRNRALQIKRPENCWGLRNPLQKGF